MVPLLFGVQAHDTVTFAVVPGVLAVVVLLAILVPSVRTARVDPMAALRQL